MKKLMLVAVLAVLCGSAFAADPRAEVSVTPAGSGVDVTIAVDVLQAWRSPPVQQAPLLGKPFVAAWETTKGTARYVNEHKLPALGWTLGGYAIKRAVDGKLDHDLKSLWVTLGLREDPDEAGESQDYHARYDLEQVGTNNSIVIEYTADGAKDDTVEATQEGSGNSIIIRPQAEEEEEEGGKAADLNAYMREEFGL